MSDDANERVVADWRERPFSDTERRRETVHHRIRVVAHDGVGVDVQHEVRRETEGAWTTAEVFESRPHGIEKVNLDERWWAA
ncbi:hypothetical protein [Halobacterium zhouii]|uniref:hypothetical protein n=1 Tax=Halobacterium zhouii TaxID=2902624 RepID=UPI001E53CA14|nr:hypothetical protein [Halobacterium zhouii]